jgi:hypothetical protein
MRTASARPSRTRSECQTRSRRSNRACLCAFRHRLACTVRRDRPSTTRRSNSSARPRLWVYAGFLIFSQDVPRPSVRYVPCAHLPTMPSRSRSQATRKQIATALLDVLEIQQTAVDRRHDAQQPALALEQRQARQILALDVQYIERAEERPLATEQELFEMRSAVRLQAADLAIEHT